LTVFNLALETGPPPPPPTWSPPNALPPAAARPPVARVLKTRRGTARRDDADDDDAPSTVVQAVPHDPVDAEAGVEPEPEVIRSSRNSSGFLQEALRSTDTTSPPEKKNNVKQLFTSEEHSDLYIYASASDIHDAKHAFVPKADILSTCRKLTCVEKKQRDNIPR